MKIILKTTLYGFHNGKELFFFKRPESSLSNRPGFTLLEIIVVIIIVGVLAAVALPTYKMRVEEMKASEGEQILIALLGAQKRYQMEYGSFANTYSDLDVTIPTPSYFIAITDASINSTDPVATVRRTGGSYTLGINADGTISCSGSGNICAQLGY